MAEITLPAVTLPKVGHPIELLAIYQEYKNTNKTIHKLCNLF